MTRISPSKTFYEFVSLDDARNALLVLYEQFECVADEFKKAAVYRIGCATCCINVGNVDITTLEGMIMRDRMSQFDRSVQRKIRKKLAPEKILSFGKRHGIMINQFAIEKCHLEGNSG